MHNFAVKAVLTRVEKSMLNQKVFSVFLFIQSDRCLVKENELKMEKQRYNWNSMHLSFFLSSCMTVAVKGK